MIHGHGGNIYAMARHLGCCPEEIIDMSSNINPLGMPPGLSAHIKDQLDRVGALPEVDNHTAIEQMAILLDVDSRRLLAGSGTTQFIYTACGALKSEKVLIIGPTYADYADACRIRRIKPHYFLADVRDQFDVDLKRLDETLHDFDTVFLCNPNNPTGRLIANHDLVRLCRAHPETHFIVDESYLPFAPADRSKSMMTCQLDNVSVLWSLSKIFGIPGLRAGFLIANEETRKRFRHYMQPWNLNSLAQCAVDYLGCHRAQILAFIDQTRRFLQQEKRRFYDHLSPHSQWSLIQSQTSYILLRLNDGHNADTVFDQMAQNHILIRNCRNFHGLSDRFIRIALKDTRNNRLALEHLVNIIQSEGLPC